MEPADAARILLRRRRMRSSLVGFAQSIQIPGAPVGGDDSELFAPVGESMARHHVLLCEALQQCIETDYGRTMVFMPPGAGKSVYASAIAPAWAMGRQPGFQVILASYGTDLAKKHGRKARAICKQAMYADTFGTGVSKATSAAEMWALNNGSEYMSGGLMSGLTGNRADCFPAGTMVSTPDGPRAIESLVDGDNVLSFDHAKGCYTVSRVAARREVASAEIVEVQTREGRRLRCTADHRVFTKERGYRQAQLLASERLVLAPKGSDVEGVPGLLQCGARREQGAPGVRGLRDRVSEASLRVREICSKWLHPLFLFKAVPVGPPRRRSYALLPYVRRFLPERIAILWLRVLATSAGKDEGVPAVLYGVPPHFIAQGVLQQELREQSALDTDGRGGKLALQNRHELRRVVQANEACDTGTRRSRMRGLQASARAAARLAWQVAQRAFHPSLRRESGEQPAGKSDNDVSRVPPEASQIRHDAVSLVARVGGGSIPVYDIEVEETRCFFANEILVHNCLIIDDPIKGAQEADSPATRASVMEAIEQDAMTRLKPRASVFLIQTRWHPLDPAGQLLPEDYDGRSGPVVCSDGMTWNVLNIPAEAEREDDPLGRQVGEMLWPEWFDAAHWAQYRAKPRLWSALYQQRPVIAGGGRFNPEWVKWYDPGEAPADLNYYGADDYAVTELADGNDPDFTEMGVVGLDEVGDLWLVDWFYGQVSTDKGIKAFISLASKWRIRRWFGEKGIIHNSLAPAINRAKRESRCKTQIELLYTPGNKLAKAEGFFALAEAGKVHMPNLPWAKRLVTQLAAFPVVAHDDGVDVCALFGRALDGMAWAYVPVVEPHRDMKPFSVEWLEYRDNQPSPVNRTR